MVFSISMLYKYNNVVRTIVVETTSPIRLETNGFNRELNITSSTENVAPHFLNEENMRNILYAPTLESMFPLLAVEDGCILSKDADVTIGFKVFLPELFTVTSADYASMHGT